MLKQTNGLMGWMAMKRLLLGAALLLTGRAGAVERTLRIEAPATVIAGRELAVTISASTDAGHGEQVGFLQADGPAELLDQVTQDPVIHTLFLLYDLLPGSALLDVESALTFGTLVYYRDGATATVSVKRLTGTLYPHHPSSFH